MDNQNILISVVMSVYNGEDYLEEAIESILNQTYKNFEFIIIDDGSTDKSLGIIHRYKELDDRIILISRENRGLIASLNEGIKKAKGKYIARMDADDISLATRFEEQVKFMEKNLDIGICGTAIISFGVGIKECTWVLSAQNERLKTELLFSSCFAHPSVMMRRNLINKHELFYDKNFKHAEDFELWTRFAQVSKMNNLTKPLLKYRILEDSITREANKNEEERYAVIKKIFGNYLLLLGIKNTEEENRLHFSLSDNTRMQVDSLNFIELKRYFTKILEANKIKKVFYEYELKKVLGKKWLWNMIYRKDMKALFSQYFLYGLWSMIKK